MGVPNLNFAVMDPTKNTVAQTAKGKRVRIESSEPPVRNRIGNKEKQKRYEEIKHWAFIFERKAQLLLK